MRKKTDSTAAQAAIQAARAKVKIATEKAAAESKAAKKRDHK
jgi:hypothetical protein